MRELQYVAGQVKILEILEKKLEGLGVEMIHATISHDGGFSVAMAVLEKSLGI